MEYSKDIVLGKDFIKNKEGVKRRGEKLISMFQKHKFITTITTICGMLIALDCFLVHSFIEILQKI